MKPVSDDDSVAVAWGDSDVAAGDDSVVVEDSSVSEHGGLLRLGYGGQQCLRLGCGDQRSRCLRVGCGGHQRLSLQIRSFQMELPPATALTLGAGVRKYVKVARGREEALQRVQLRSELLPS